MNLVVSGSRSITDERAVEQILSQYMSFGDPLIVGDAGGVDAIAAALGRRRFMKLEIHHPDWSTHGKKAGPIRNAKMLEDADLLVAIWDGKSRGTKNTIDTALRLKIETHVYFL